MYGALIRIVSGLILTSSLRQDPELVASWRAHRSVRRNANRPAGFASSTPTSAVALPPPQVPAAQPPPPTQQRSRQIPPVPPPKQAQGNTTSDLTQYLWFHAGPVSREQAETRVAAAGAEGAFLVRASASHPGDYVLSVRVGRRCLHFHLRSDGVGGVSLDNSSLRFASLPLMVNLFSSFPSIT
jgi:hypothetical protein